MPKIPVLFGHTTEKKEIYAQSIEKSREVLGFSYDFWALWKKHTFMPIIFHDTGGGNRKTEDSWASQVVMSWRVRRW